MPEGTKTVAKNRKAFHDYHILETYEAGLALVGTEVKAIRDGLVNLTDCYARSERGEMILHGMHIGAYDHGNRSNHEPMRPRKLLLHRREITKLIGRVNERGFTLVPLKVYFTRGKAKVELALAKGKKEYDKRETLAKREAEREVARGIKEASREF
jgi:SsrA-binding protein